LIVKHFDTDLNGKLTFEEFNLAFTPLKDEYQKLLSKTPPVFIEELPLGKYYKITMSDFFSDPTVI